MNRALLASLIAALTTMVFAQTSEKTIPELTKGMTKRAGLIDSYVDMRSGKLFLELPAAESKTGIVGEYLYTDSLATGLGLNDVGLDRSELGDTEVVRFRIVGGKLLVEVPNLQFRADSTDAAERRAVEQAFPESILWSSPVLAQDSAGHSLVDFTSFVVRDAHNSARQLKGTLDEARSVLDLTNCKSFPDNLELEALLTFKLGTGSPRGTSPIPDATTFVQHHSLVKLPEPGFKTRAFDPRAGSFPFSYLDYAAPLSQPLEKRLISRFRLEKADPTAERSPVKKPIVFYIDSGAPPAIRDALKEGVGRWNQAFEAAGYVGAFRAEILPDGVDPLDARYNVVQWIHRTTRGYSYGTSIVDPRTGEIVKGLVRLESMRGRQDVLLFQSLLGTDGDGPEQLALDRIRQLGAHEVGHALGFAHNFAASTYGRASVMDYPAPLIKVGPSGVLDFSDAYSKGIGAWDKLAVQLAYGDPAPGQNEAKWHEDLIQQGLKRGMIFLTDQDADDRNGINPRANRWDNGKDPVLELKNALAIRRTGIANFGERNIKAGTPVADMELTFGPLYFWHRYNIDATLKMVGGLHYVHALRGDGQEPQWPVTGPRQMEALDALLDCCDPATLDVPLTIANKIGPRPFGFGGSSELFASQTNGSFDSLAAASAAADLVIEGLLSPTRCARVLELSTRDETLPKLDDVLDHIADRVFGFPAKTTRELEIWMAVRQVFVTRLMDLAGNPATSSPVRSRARGELRRVIERLSIPQGRPLVRQLADQNREIASEITRFLSAPLESVKRTPAPLPAIPGGPIGMGCEF